MSTANLERRVSALEQGKEAGGPDEAVLVSAADTEKMAAVEARIAAGANIMVIQIVPGQRRPAPQDVEGEGSP